jgi:glycine cleavage system H protein
MTVLFVLATILLFLGIDWAVRRMREGKAPAVQPVPARSNPVRIPEGIFFAKSHTWLNLFPSGKVRIGIDDFVGRLLENPEVVLLKNPGDHVERGEPIVQLREGGHTLTIRSPLSGTILGVNDELPKHPQFFKGLLFSDGWAYAVKPESASELKNLLLGQETRAWIREEFGRLRDVFAGANGGSGVVPALLQDGGPPVAGALKAMSDDVWGRFEEEFLQVH